MSDKQDIFADDKKEISADKKEISADENETFAGENGAAAESGENGNAAVSGYAAGDAAAGGETESSADGPDGGTAPDAPPPKPRVFRNRNFVLTFLGGAVSNIGALFYSFAVSFFLLDLTGNNAVIQGTYLALCGLTFVLVSPIGGVISDRFNKARIMYLCDYLRGGLVLLTTALLLVFRDQSGAQVALLFACGILGQVIGAIFSPAVGALFPLILPEHELQQANAYTSVLSSVQSIVGVLLAGLFYGLMRPTSLFLLVGICYLLSGVSEMFIRYRATLPDTRMTLRSVGRDLRDGVRYLFGQKALVALFSVVVFVNFFFAPVGENFLAYFIRTDVAGHAYLLSDRMEPEMWSAIFSCSMGLASAVFGVVLGARTARTQIGRYVIGWLFFVSFLILGGAAAYSLLIPRGQLNAFLLVFCAVCFLLGMALVFVNIPTSTKLLIITDKAMLGKMSSLINMVSQGLIPLAVFGAGYVIQLFGAGALLYVCGAGLLLSSVVGLCNRELRKI